MTWLSALALVALAATAQAQSPAYLDHSALTRELRTVSYTHLTLPTKRIV